MKNDRTKKAKKARVRKLRKSKIKGISFFEKVSLKTAGYFDGRRSLPREDPADGWISPHLDKEVHSYDEFCTRTWGRLQIDQEKAYAHLGELMDTLVHTKCLLEKGKIELEEAKEAKAVDTVRKFGESRLSDAQVTSRRGNERAKRLAPLKSRLSCLESELSSLIDEFSRLHKQILEEINSTRMICKRVKDHLFQRIDVYWEAAMQKHPENAQMPVTPCIEAKSCAEGTYLEPHKLLMQRADLLNKTFTEEEKEES